jgi:UDP-GlcNAc:undecaprenyl-phosphate GlcNAc-1-phosphate transferase
MPERISHKPADIVEKVIFFLIIIFSFFLFCIFFHHRTLLLSQFSFVFIQSFLIVVALTPCVIWLARKFRIVDMPDERKHHELPTPLLGGVGIYASLVISVLHSVALTPEVVSILAGASIIFVLGMLDDIFGLSSMVRLIGQVAAALIVISSGLIVTFLPNTLFGHTASVLVTVIWILGIVNTVNFVDGVDGLASGISVIAAIFFGMIAFNGGHDDVAMLSIVVMAAGIGFLFFNFKPAKIYLGDAGSTLLGFLLASIALFGQWSNNGPVIALGIPVLILGLLIFDMCYITVSRVISGRVKNVREWLDYTGRDHFHHRLLDLGLSERQTVIFMYGTCFILGLSALVLENTSNQFYIIVLVLQATGMLLNISVLMIVGRTLAASREMLSRELQTEKIIIDVYRRNVSDEHAFLADVDTGSEKHSAAAAEVDVIAVPHAVENCSFK